MFAAAISEDESLVLAMHQHAKPFLEHIEASRAFLDPWLPWVAKIVDEDSARVFIQRFLDKLAASDGVLAFIQRDTQICGGVLLRTIDWQAKRTEVGYWIDKREAGRGLASRSVATIVRYAFDELSLDRVDLQAATTNKPSCRLAERLGFAREGTIRAASIMDGMAMDHAFYGLLRLDRKVAVS
jgi:ribosomal-protein-serine acetyltransferase